MKQQYVTRWPLGRSKVITLQMAENNLGFSWAEFSPYLYGSHNSVLKKLVFGAHQTYTYILMNFQLLEGDRSFFSGWIIPYGRVSILIHVRTHYKARHILIGVGLSKKNTYSIWMGLEPSILGIGFLGIFCSTNSFELFFNMFFSEW